MSQDLVAARRALSKVSTDLKREQYISAATAIRDAARLFTRGVPMMKNEQEEFVSMLQAGCDLMRFNKELPKIFPLAITYKPGQESALADLMNQLIEILQEASTEDATRKHAERKRLEMAKGRQELADGEHDEARRTFTALTDEYEDDAHLATEVGESFMEAGLFEDASKHLGAAAKLTPDSAHVFNRLGIALRKMKRYEVAEEHFQRALALEPSDDNLYFNMGRLYLDWMDWRKTVAYAEKALELNPGFDEAAKMAAYARRKLAESS